MYGSFWVLRIQLRFLQRRKKRSRFPSSWVEEGKSTLPPAPFRLSPAVAKVANARAMSIRVPIGFGWQPKAVFVKTVAMKSHSWKQMVATGILWYCLRGLLGKQLRETLFKMFDVLARLCVETVHISQVHTLEQDTHRALSLLECDFPVAIHVCVTFCTIFYFLLEAIWSNLWVLDVLI